LSRENRESDRGWKAIYIYYMISKEGTI
jgi:hypothetical protein